MVIVPREIPQDGVDGVRRVRLEHDGIRGSFQELRDGLPRLVDLLRNLVADEDVGSRFSEILKPT